jgi:nicotinate phosphoribosyltransferase
MKSDFVDFLALFHSTKIRARRRRGAAGRDRHHDPRPWLHTIMFEIPVLAIVSELYFRRTQPKPDLREGAGGCKAKIDQCARLEPELDFRISDYGTRRRFSRAWHEEVHRTLQARDPADFAGTSNVWWRCATDMTPLGTMAHEYMQACQALGPAPARLADLRLRQVGARNIAATSASRSPTPTAPTRSCAISTCTSASCSTARATIRAIRSPGASG